MSNHEGGYVVGIEMDDLEREEDPDYPGDQLGSPFKNTFASILKVYKDERAWWVAAKDLLDIDVDFAAKVSCTSSRLHVWRTIQHSLWWRAPFICLRYTLAGCSEGAGRRGGVKAASYGQSDGGPPP